MSSFELFPEPTVLAVEAGVFLVNMAIIKKFMVDPYLKLKDKRDAATTGSKEGAAAALEKCESISAAIAKAIHAANDDARGIKEKIQVDASQKRDALVAAATKEARGTIESMQADVATQLNKERARVSEIVGSLTSEVYATAIN